MVLVSDILDNNFSILQTKFSYRERHETRRVGLETVPLHQHIEGCQGEREPRLKIRPDPVHDLLAVAHDGQHGEHRRDEHAVLPRAALTQFEVGRVPLGGMERGIAQDNHPSIDLAHQPLEGVIGDIGRRTVPPYHQAILVEQQTEFAADNPPMVGEAFPADLLGAAAFAEGVHELDAIRVDDAEPGRRGQENPRPVLMGLQETKEPRPLGEAGEQRPIVARQPAIERPVPHTFEGMQQPQGDHLTGPEVRLRMFGNGVQLLIDLIEQRGDQLDGDHGLLRAWQGVTLSTSMEEVHDQYNKASKYYCIYWFVRDLTPLVSMSDF